MYIALLSDIHANIYALDAVFEDFADKKIDHILVAGDLIGYYYWPKEVVQKLMNDDRVVCISGNHETYLARSLSNQNDLKHYKKKYGSGYQFCKDLLTHGELEWLVNLPQIVNLNIKDMAFTIAHGSLNDQEEYIYPDSSSEVMDNISSNSDFIVLGHTHYPFIKNNITNTIINPGSVGQPRDISRLASYVLINTDNLSISFRRVRFEIEEIIKASKNNDPELTYLQTVLTR